MKSLTDRVLILARQKKITGASLAKQLEISEAAVSKWFKTGKINKSHLHRIAEILDTTVHYLFTGEQCITTAEGVLVPVLNPSLIKGYLTGKYCSTLEYVPTSSGSKFSYSVSGEDLSDSSHIDVHKSNENLKRYFIFEPISEKNHSFKMLVLTSQGQLLITQEPARVSSTDSVVGKLIETYTIEI